MVKDGGRGYERQMEPPSKDDPANPYGFQKAWGRQPQGSFRIGPMPKAGATPINEPAPPPAPRPQARPLPEPTPQRPSSILTGSAAEPVSRSQTSGIRMPRQPALERPAPAAPSGPRVDQTQMPLAAARMQAGARPAPVRPPSERLPEGPRPMLSQEALAALGAIEGGAPEPRAAWLAGRLPLVVGGAVVLLAIVAAAVWVMNRPADTATPAALAPVEPAPVETAVTPPVADPSLAPPIAATTPTVDALPPLVTPAAPPAAAPPRPGTVVAAPAPRTAPPTPAPIAAAPPPLDVPPPPPAVVAPPQPRPAPPPAPRPQVDPDGPISTRLPDGAD